MKKAYNIIAELLVRIHHIENSNDILKKYEK